MPTDGYHFSALSEENGGKYLMTNLSSKTREREKKKERSTIQPTQRKKEPLWKRIDRYSKRRDGTFVIDLNQRGVLLPKL